MNSSVNLGKVSDHVDAMDRNGFDHLVGVESISFSSLEKSGQGLTFII